MQSYSLGKLEKCMVKITKYYIERWPNANPLNMRNKTVPSAFIFQKTIF